MKKALAALCILLSSYSYAANEDLDDLRAPSLPAAEWRLIKNDKTRNIKVYDKREEGKTLRSFKAEYEVEESFETLAKVYFDFESYKDWYYEVIDSKLLKKVSSTEFYYYIVHNAPPTLADRDAVLHAVIEPYNAKRGYALFKINSVPDYLPAKPPYVRIKGYTINIKLMPIGNNKIRGIIEGYVDPGAAFPSWAINYVQRRAPYEGVLGFMRVLNTRQMTGKYQTPAPFSFTES
ncbi:START domain-containing protein [Agitococcus lubricus]|uniref:START domain-containing protein n=1 Tax=Agitococcus lubricus TaxID=1077255 RepID=A0A2T5J485_9GAMM|nr:START domain-containing protein [Agitococcus lubricus]PTQ91366.1 START domain-containing protein [Agitococcus lubricus]